MVKMPQYEETRFGLGEILLHGPPGTGKSLLARSIATWDGITVFNASPSRLMSTYIREGEEHFGLLECFLPLLISPTGWHE